MAEDLRIRIIETADTRGGREAIRSLAELKAAQEALGRNEEQLSRARERQSKSFSGGTSEVNRLMREQHGIQQDLERASGDYERAFRSASTNRSSLLRKEATEWRKLGSEIHGSHLRLLDFGRKGLQPMTIAIGAGVTAVGLLGNSIEALGGLLATLPAAAGAAGLAILNFKALNIGTIEKSAKAVAKADAQYKAGLITAKAYHTAIGKATVQLNSAEKQGLKFFQTIKTEADRAKLQIQREMLPAIGDLGKALEKNNRTIEQTFRSSAHIQAGGIKQLAHYVGSRQGQSDLAGFSRTSRLELAAATTAGNAFLQSIMMINRLAEPMIARISGDLDGLFLRFNSWAGSGTGQNKLRAFFQETSRATEQWSSLLWNAVKALHEFFQATAGQGNSFLKWLDDGSARLDKWLASAEGQKDISKVFSVLGDVLKEVSRELGIIVPYALQTAQAFTAVAAAMRSVVSAIPGGQQLAALALLAKFGFGFKPGKLLIAGSGAAGAFKAGAGLRLPTPAAAGAVGVAGEGAAVAEGAAAVGGGEAVMGGVRGGLGAAAKTVGMRVGLGIAVIATAIATKKLYDLATAPSIAQAQHSAAQSANVVLSNIATGPNTASALRAGAKLDLVQLGGQQAETQLALSQLHSQDRSLRRQLKGAHGVAKQQILYQLAIDRASVAQLKADAARVAAEIAKATKIKLGAATADQLKTLFDQLNNYLPKPGAGAVGKPHAAAGSSFLPVIQNDQSAKVAAATAKGLKDAMAAAQRLYALTPNAPKGLKDAAYYAYQFMVSFGKIPTAIDVARVRADHLFTTVENRRLHVDVSFKPDMTALLNAENQVENNRLHIPVIWDVPSKPQIKARGGEITRPTAIVGEEAPRHPEWVIATNPAYRQANVGHWMKAGHDLGIPGYAKGGKVGSKALSTVMHEASGYLHAGAGGMLTNLRRQARANKKNKSNSWTVPGSDRFDMLAADIEGQEALAQLKNRPSVYAGLAKLEISDYQHRLALLTKFIQSSAVRHNRVVFSMANQEISNRFQQLQSLRQAGTTMPKPDGSPAKDANSEIMSERLDEIKSLLQTNLREKTISDYELGTVKAFLNSTVGSFASGTSYVSRTGMATVHRGEQIVSRNQVAAGGGAPPVVHTVKLEGSDPITMMIADKVNLILGRQARQMLRDRRQ